MTILMTIRGKILAKTGGGEHGAERPCPWCDRVTGKKTKYTRRGYTGISKTGAGKLNMSNTQQVFGLFEDLFLDYFWIIFGIIR